MDEELQRRRFEELLTRIRASDASGALARLRAGKRSVGPQVGRPVGSEGESDKSDRSGGSGRERIVGFGALGSFKCFGRRVKVKGRSVGSQVGRSVGSEGKKPEAARYLPYKDSDDAPELGESAG